LVERGATEHVIAGPSVSRQYGLPAPQ
jgi:hypothetical protein